MGEQLTPRQANTAMALAFAGLWLAMFSDEVDHWSVVWGWAVWGTGIGVELMVGAYALGILHRLR